MTKAQALIPACLEGTALERVSKFTAAEVYIENTTLLQQAV